MSYNPQQQYQQPPNIYQQLNLNQPQPGYQTYQQQAQPYPQQPPQPQQPQQHPIQGQFYHNQPPGHPYYQQQPQHYPAPTPAPRPISVQGYPPPQQYAHPQYAIPRQPPQHQRQSQGFAPSHSYSHSVPNVHAYAPPTIPYATPIQGHPQQSQWVANSIGPSTQVPPAQASRPLPPPRRAETLSPAFAQPGAPGHAPSASFSSSNSTSMSTFSSPQPPHIARAQSLATHPPPSQTYAPPVAASVSLPGPAPTRQPVGMFSSTDGVSFHQAPKSSSPARSSPPRSSPVRRPLPTPNAGRSESQISTDSPRSTKHLSLISLGNSNVRDAGASNHPVTAATGSTLQRSPSPVKAFQQGFSHPRDWSQDSNTTTGAGRYSPVKRRESPPRFNPHGNNSTAELDSPATATSSSSSSEPISQNWTSSPSTTSPTSSEPSPSSETPPTSPTKKFVPLWKRALGVGKLSRSNSKSAGKVIPFEGPEKIVPESDHPGTLLPADSSGGHNDSTAKQSLPQGSTSRSSRSGTQSQSLNQNQSQTSPHPHSQWSQHAQPYGQSSVGPQRQQGQPNSAPQSSSSLHRRESAHGGSAPRRALRTVEEGNSSLEYDPTDAYSGILKGTDSANSSMNSKMGRLPGGSLEEEEEDSDDEEESRLAYDESMHSIGSVDDDDSEGPAPSPQYGIRDLPAVRQSAFAPHSTSSTIHTQPPQPGQVLPNPQNGHVWKSNVAVAQGNVSSSSGLSRRTSVGRAGVPLPRPPVMDSGPESHVRSRSSAHNPMQMSTSGNSAASTQSMTLRFAAMGLNSSGGASANESPSSSSSGSHWPASVSHHPRAPASSSSTNSAVGFNPSAGYTSTSRGTSSQSASRGRADMIDLDDAPPVGLRGRTPSPARGQSAVRHVPPQSQTQSRRPLPQVQHSHSSAQNNYTHPNGHQNNGTAPPPSMNIESPSAVGGREHTVDIPQIKLESENDDDGPVINISAPTISISVTGDDDDTDGGPQINVAGPDDDEGNSQSRASQPPAKRPLPPIYRGGLVCAGCGKALVGRIVSAMGLRWHPNCFKCTACDELLEHVSSYEHEGRPYCHLDYHENFAPRCYSCKTAIIEERFISLDDPALGKRTYHEQHFFCAECGDPFITPSSARGRQSGELELNVNGDGQFVLDDDVGFTVYKGHPYCEPCHVRLRMPKCRKCKRSIRDGMQAVEALGSKWCWGCFVCAGCDKPFEDPSFFQKEGLPFCERCFSIILRNDI